MFPIKLVFTIQVYNFLYLNVLSREETGCLQDLAEQLISHKFIQQK